MFGKKQNRLQAKENISGYAFVAPALICFLLFMAFPFFLTLILSFFDFNFLKVKKLAHIAKFIKFCGLDNFATMLQDRRFLEAIKNTAVYTIATVPASILLGLVLAYVLNGNVFGKKVLRLAFFVPYISSVVALGAVFKFLFREDGMKIVKTFLVGLVAVAFVLPLAWMVTSSLKETKEVFSPNWQWLPETFQWKNYATVWTDPEVSMLNAFYNTAFITVISTVVQLAIASLAAYAFAKIDFKGKGIVFTMFLCTMMMPTEVTIVPRFMLFKTVGLYNNLWSVILPHFFNASAVFMLRQFYMGLPSDLMEAAKIDGAGHVQIFSRIMMPLTKSALVSLAMLSFISCWNEYMTPLIFLAKKNLYTISQVIRWYMLDDLQRYDLNMAAATSAIIPVLILFVFCQKYFVEGIATSGVKG